MIVVAKLKAKKGEEEKMENALKEIIPDVEKEEGTLVYTLHRSQNDPGVFLFYEKYRDADALTHHSPTPHFKSLFANIMPLLEGQPEIEMYEELVGIKSKS